MKTVLIAIALLCVVTACGSDNSDTVTIELTATTPAPAAAHTSQTSSATQATSSAQLGRNDARHIIDTCFTEDQLQDALLIINARRYRISCMASEAAADEYIQGFMDELKERGDTLYTTLAPR